MAAEPPRDDLERSPGLPRLAKSESGLPIAPALALHVASCSASRSWMTNLGASRVHTTASDGVPATRSRPTEFQKVHQRQVATQTVRASDRPAGLVLKSRWSALLSLLISSLLPSTPNEAPYWALDGTYDAQQLQGLKARPDQADGVQVGLLRDRQRAGSHHLS